MTCAWARERMTFHIKLRSGIHKSFFEHTHLTDEIQPPRKRYTPFPPKSYRNNKIFKNEKKYYLDQNVTTNHHIVLWWIISMKRILTKFDRKRGICKLNVLWWESYVHNRKKNCHCIHIFALWTTTVCAEFIHGQFYNNKLNNLHLNDRELAAVLFITVIYGTSYIISITLTQYTANWM